MSETSNFENSEHVRSIERAVLGGLMLETERYDSVCLIISHNDFEGKDHQSIFKSMGELVENNKPLDPFTLSDKLDSRNLLQSTGGRDYLVELAQTSPTAANLEAYAELIRERSIRRKLQRINSEISELITNPQGRDSGGLLDEAESKIFALNDEASRTSNKIRMNVGTIQDTETLKVRTHRRSGGKPLGEIEEAFAASLTKGDTFLIGGKIVRFESLREMVVEVTQNANRQPKIATFMGTKFATSTKLSDRILDSFKNENWEDLPEDTINWLNKQKEFSELPVKDSLLVETFFRKSRHHMVVYSFAGRNANQTLGLILSKRLEELDLAPLGFVANDYATLLWGLKKVENPIELFNSSAIELGLDKWLSGNALMKRTFKSVATVAGLIDRNLPGLRKSGRQTTFSSDILYDTLVKYDPSHLLLKITKDEAMKGLIDFNRIKEMFDRVDDNIIHKNLPHVSPLAAPMLLEVGTVPIEGQARELILQNEVGSLMREAGLD